MSRALWWILPAAAALTACGHPASQEECDEIFNRSAELELRAQNITDETRIKMMTADLREKKGGEILSRCVGKRITNTAVACVRKAGSPAEIERCVD
jgi:hypothetical protein